MKPEDQETQEECAENPTPVVGDVIGDTAYSERFVLKILIKLANLDTLKDEIKEKAFEDDLCVLWDMTAERDVVLFLLKHNVLNLFCFALPVVDSPRIIEIIVGIIGNMCCQKEAVTTLLKMDSFLTILLEYIKSEDSLILVQVLRLVSSSLFIADDDDLALWMGIFKSVEYPSALYFMLKNSSHKELLNTALENLNTVTSYCNTEKYRSDFFTQFVTSEALDSLSAAFTEVLSQKEAFERDDLERIFVISLQIILNIIGFEKSPEIYENDKNELINMVAKVLSYYENKLVYQKEIDTDLIDVIDSTNVVVRIMQLSRDCQPDSYFTPSYCMWKSLKEIVKSDKNGCSFEDDNTDDFQEFTSKIKPPLSTLLCSYLEKCPESHLYNSLDEISKDYDEILSMVTVDELKSNVNNRTSNYRTRLKDNVES